MELRLALIVGVDNYAIPGIDLKYAANDVAMMSEIFSSSTYRYDVHTLVNSEATRSSIIRKLTEFRQLEPEAIVFYFAGHGVTTGTGTYLVLSETEMYDEGLELDTLSRALDIQGNDRVSSTLTLLDCCRSGAASPYAARPTSVNGELVRAATSDDLDRIGLQSSRTRAVIAACLPSQEAWEDPEVQHGVFSYYLSEGLSGAAVDKSGRITVAGLYQHVSAPFEKDTRQTPVLRGDLYGDFILAEGLPVAKFTQETNEDRRKSQELSIQRGRQFLNEYTLRNGTTRTEWLARGYQESCKSLEPVLLWFEKEILKSDLASNIEFLTLYDSAWAEAGHLANLAIDLETEKGNVVKHLGSGTFGAVWQVVNTAGPFAYKVYSPSELRNSDKLKRFRQGYIAMRQLNHKNIVQVYDMTQCPLGFTMDYIEGPNLREMGAPKDDPLRIISLLVTVAEALRHAHAHSVIHRDIKPENIIMQYDATTGEFEPFVTDFDLAWFTTATQLTNQAIGALSYAAPEQLTPRSAILARQPTVDVYSFGQLAYYCAVDSNPTPMDFTGNEATLSRTLISWPNAEAADAFMTLYRDCNSPTPDSRPQSIQDCIDKLLNVRAHLVSATPDSPITEVRLIEGISFAFSGSRSSEFASKSGRTEVSLTIRNAGRREGTILEARLRAIGGIGVIGTKNSIRRHEITRQIDSAIDRYPNVSRRAGSHPQFEVYIDIRSLKLKYGAIQDCFSIIDRVVEVMER
ncbi:protein kinase domain-containing protein [Amycolatopsis pittospori]|uniref:protein kinase domain-containing protein n=1 Tax=Amycolatopsis pittospori TaxID=2749434 RepID=UPI0015F03F66|nr:caspase family protein [Amycolatopsis pittospori]